MKSKDQELLAEAYGSIVKKASPLKQLNTVNAVKAINQKASELTKKKVVLGPGEPPYGPFYNDETTGELKVLVSVVGNDPLSSVQPRQDYKIRIMPELVNSKKPLERAINTAVQEYLK